MKSHFSAEFFRGNRERLRELFTGTAPIVITANALLQRNGDSPYPFRQDSNFWYLTGIDIPEAVLVMDKGKEYLIVPNQSPNDEVFGSLPDYEKIAKISGISTILDGKSGWKQLSARLKRARHAATAAPPPAYSEHYAFYTNPAARYFVRKIKEANPNITILDLRKHLMKLRVIKQPEEIGAIRQAIDITAETLKVVHKKLQSYSYEYEIEADILAGFRSRGAEGPGFPSIVGAGANSAILHYQHNNESLKNSRQVVLDVGAEVSRYSADISRTFALGAPSMRLRQVYAAVQEVQSFALERLKPGVIYRDYEMDVHEFMGEQLRELGLIKTISTQTVRKYFPHATSHFLGLNVHDVGDYRVPLAAGMVMTIEPGIYIAEENIGVRIEDDVLLTDGKTEVLSGRIPQKLW